MNRKWVAALGAGALCGTLAFAGSAAAAVKLIDGLQDYAPQGANNDVFGPIYGAGYNPGQSSLPVEGWYIGDIGGSAGFSRGTWN